MLNTYVKMIALIAIIGMCASAAMGNVVVQDVEIRGSVVNNSTIYDYSSFAGFWYCLDNDQYSETMGVAVDVGNRTIDEDGIVYTCTRQHVDYKSDYLNTTYGGYYIIGFMADKYICYDGKTDKLVKLLVEWSSSDKTILSMDDPLKLPDGYMLVAEQIDLQGYKVWLKLYKDGEFVDESVVIGGDTYVYEHPYKNKDVLMFSAKIDSVFRGTESNMVVVKEIFMRSDTILDIDGGDTFGIMKVKSTSSTAIMLRNDEVVDLGKGDEIGIMDGLYFKVADNDNLRYCLAKTISLSCDECPPCPVFEPCPEQTPCPPCIDATPEVVIEYVNVTVPAEPAKENTPGFEAVLALAGLLAVAAIVLRQRE